jgi:perosamine synthetase
MKQLPIAGPSITAREIDYVTDAVSTAWYGEANKYHARFEAAFAAHCGRRHAVSLPSCTSGLHLALMALGVGPGDEVIVPDVTWIASAAPIRYVGATPVFADIASETWCLDPASFSAAITPRTKAAIVVDLYGAMPDWDAIQAVADAHGVALIEDAAEAVGACWRGRPAGSFGVFSAFSFHGSKTLTTGEGGMLLTDDDALLARVLQLRDHGRAPGDIMFFNDEVGHKYKMSALQAALGLAQIERVNDLVAGKRRIFGWYRDAFGDWSGGTLNPDVEGLDNAYWMSTLLLDPALGITKERLLPRLQAQGVGSRPFFYPLSDIPAFRDTAEAARARASNPISYSLSPYGVNLPSALSLSESDVQQAVGIVKRIVDES